MTNEEVDKMARALLVMPLEPVPTLHGHIPVATTMALARRVVGLLGCMKGLDIEASEFGELEERATAEIGEILARERVLKGRVAGLQSKVAEAEAHLRLECSCCGGTAAEWFVTDGDSLLCGCDGAISCCSETYPYATADDCKCGGDGRPKEIKG